jgi:hypothetical protein
MIARHGQAQLWHVSAAADQIAGTTRMCRSPLSDSSRLSSARLRVDHVTDCPPAFPPPLPLLLLLLLLLWCPQAELQERCSRSAPADP